MGFYPVNKRMFNHRLNLVLNDEQNFRGLNIVKNAVLMTNSLVECLNQSVYQNELVLRNVNSALIQVARERELVLRNVNNALSQIVREHELINRNSIKNYLSTP